MCLLSLQGSLINKGISSTSRYSVLRSHKKSVYHCDETADGPREVQPFPGFDATVCLDGLGELPLALLPLLKPHAHHPLQRYVDIQDLPQRSSPEVMVCSH